MSDMFTQDSGGGTWSDTEAFLKGAVNGRTRMSSILHKYGKIGTDALRSATPVDTSETANSWYYEVTTGEGGMSIVWRNNHMAGSTPLVILLHYGHGTGTGGYVQGREFISSTIEPIFDQIEAEVLKAVTT